MTEAVKKLARPVARKILGKRYDEFFGYHRCNVCGKRCLMKPLPSWFLYNLQVHGFRHNIFRFETQNLGYYSCSKCGANDRERLYVLYLEKWLQHCGEGKLLDIAPADSLRKWLKMQPKINYRSVDLVRTDVDDRVDITDMAGYGDNQFDFIICSHVLEHIPDDRKALGELYRVLKPGGEAIIMVPLMQGLEKTAEGGNTADEAFCWREYGQADHVRLYAKTDFLKRIEDAGFTINQLGGSYFDQAALKRFEILPSSVLYIGSKLR
ncbi:MAG: methyltransferase domain-containing protein [Bacteroidota bacterium]